MLIDVGHVSDCGFADGVGPRGFTFCVHRTRTGNYSRRFSDRFEFHLQLHLRHSSCCNHHALHCGHSRGVCGDCVRTGRNCAECEVAFIVALSFQLRWTVQRNLRGGDDRAPAIRILNKDLALNRSGWLPCALREGTNADQPEDKRHNC